VRSDVRERKRALRRRARQSLRVVPAERGASAIARLCEWRALAEARVVSLYAALPGEINVEPLAEWLWARGSAVLFPRIEGRDLALVPVREWSQLAPGAHGIREPLPGLPSVAAEDVGVFVIPGLFFDRAGRRLGRGRGFYDRLLAAAGTRAVRVGLCLAEQLIEEVPREPWDERMDWIATDAELVRTAARPLEGSFSETRRQQ
jgi:5-formyltetrahydrofolate cyclo-ligase